MTEKRERSSARASIPDWTALEEGFPSVMLSKVGTQESWRKEVHRPATSTHKWWAKRLGTVFRGIITSATTPSDADAEPAYSTKTNLNSLVILDPFAGSGVTAVEVVKLGARAVSFDINPVATLVQRQAIQRWDDTALKSAYLQVEETCRGEVDRVHRTKDGRTVLYYFWVATIDCPECNETINLFDSTVFSRNAYPKRVPKAQVVCPLCLDIQESRYDFTSTSCVNGHLITPAGPVLRTQAVCVNGHSTKVLRALNGKLPGYRMYAKMVVDGRGLKTYEPIDEWDRALYRECENLLTKLPNTAVLPSGGLTPGNNTNQALNWQFTTWRQFFNARQLYSLSLIATAIRDLRHGPEREALCALFSGALEFNNRFTSFKGEGTGAVRHMFSHHILKPERTPLEAHPWGTPYSSGAFSTLLKSRIERAHAYKQAPVELVLQDGAVHRKPGLSESLGTEINQDWLTFEASSARTAYVTTRNAADTDLPEGSVDLVVTDPPYMDNVHYAELADFFHAWLRAMEPFDGYPVDETTRREGEVQHAEPSEFGKAIEAVWAECHRVLKPGGLLAFTFHQARVAGWVQVIESLRGSGFCVTAVQPVKGEMTTSIVKSGAREPSNLDSVVVCRRVADGATSPHASLSEALSTAYASLGRLMDAGIDVGAGDVRSVVRGSLLAYVASTGAELDAAVATIDAHASASVARLTEPEGPELTEPLPLALRA
jgi:putative DNA methylase